MGGRFNPEWQPNVDDSSSFSSEMEKLTAPTKRRALTVATVKRWIAKRDQDLNIATWLTYTASDHVTKLTGFCP